MMNYMRENFGDVEQVTLTNWQIFGSSNLAVISTDVDWTTSSGDKPPTPDKQVIVAEKTADGSWQWKIVIFNAGV